MHLAQQIARLVVENTPSPEPSSNHGGFLNDFTTIVKSLEGLLEAGGVLLSALVAYLSARTYRRIGGSSGSNPPPPPPPPSAGGTS